MLISARSIGSRAAASLRPGVAGHVLASFERTCDLVTDAGAVVALVWDGIGKGPLNVVLDDRLGAALLAGTALSVAEGILSVGDLRVDLSSALPWDARPDWMALRARREAIIAAARAARRSIAGLEERSLLKQAGPAVEAAVAAFRGAVERGGRNDVEAALVALCGLGPGLTPAGDDWLAGWLLGQHLSPNPSPFDRLRAGSSRKGGRRHPLAWQERGQGVRFSPAGAGASRPAWTSALSWSKEGRGGRLTALVLTTAATRTTVLSRAFLACAAAGEADAIWHDLLDALAGGAQRRIEEAARHILSHGATSGVAMLAGFISGIEHPPDL